MVNTNNYAEFIPSLPACGSYANDSDSGSARHCKSPEPIIQLIKQNSFSAISGKPGSHNSSTLCSRNSSETDISSSENDVKHSLVTFNELLQTTPTMTGRYDRIIPLEAQQENWKIKPETSLCEEQAFAGAWSRYTNPDGQPYFHLIVEKNQYLTEADLSNYEKRELVEEIVKVVQTEIRERSLVKENLYVVLEEMDGDWAYYMVNDVKQTIFWLAEFDASWIAAQINGLPSLVHMRQWFIYEYWSFREHFSHIGTIADETVDELIGILSQGSIDSLTSTGSTTIYTPEECLNMMSIVKQLKKTRHTNSGETSKCEPYVTWTVSRLMAMLAHGRFMNMYGHFGARLEPEQSIRGIRNQYRTIVISILSPLLFYAPDVHLRRLEKIWVDKTINEIFWRKFVDQLRDEWEQLVINSTVIMTANVAFLAIPNVAINDSRLSFCQVPSLLSTITSLGSIILGLLLVRQHRTKAKETARDAATYLNARTHHTLGLEILAIMYSLPYALLMWSMVYFVAAIAILCFTSSKLWMKLIFGATWLAVSCLTIWTIWTGWTNPDPSAYKRLNNWLEHCYNKLHHALYVSRRRNQDDLEKQSTLDSDVTKTDSNL